MAQTEQPKREPTPTEIMVYTMTKDRNFQLDVQRMLPPHINLDKFIAAAVTAVQRNAEQLTDCDRQSVYNAVADAAARGLVPDGRQGAIVPFSTRVKRGDRELWVKRAQFMIMPEGIIEAAARVGIHMYAVSVYELDHLRLWNDGDGQHVEHSYNALGNRGERVGALAVGRTRDGQTYIEAMGMDELARARKASKTPDRGPWQDWPERMEQKTVLHRLNKRMPGISIPDDDEFSAPTHIRVQAAPETPAAVPKQPVPTAPRQERPKALQRMVDTATGEVYTPSPEQAPAASQPASEQPSPASATPAPAPGTPRSAAGDPF